MKLRTRKLIGIIATPIYLTIYALIAMAVGGHFIVGRGLVPEFITFIVLGLAWLPGAMLIVRWMSRPDDHPAQD
jgi:hypothetical protein